MIFELCKKCKNKCKREKEIKSQVMVKCPDFTS